MDFGNQNNRTQSKCNAFKIDKGILSDINSFAISVCKNIGYDISEGVNASRRMKNTSKRHVAIFVIHEKFVKYDNVDIEIAKIFGKARTTVIRNVKRVSDLLSTGDAKYTELKKVANAEKCETMTGESIRALSELIEQEKSKK